MAAFRPKLSVLQPNVTQVDLGSVTLVFSYETPLACLIPGLGWLVNRDCVEYSRTSAKHRTQRGWKDRPHLDAERFNTLLDVALSLDFNQPGAPATMIEWWNDLQPSERMGG